jgi:hypothetical protein
VPSREKADCSHRFESLEPANLTSVLFIADEEFGGLFLRLNERLRLPLVQLSHQQADVRPIGYHASQKTTGLVQFFEAVPKSALPIHFPMN